MEVAMIRGRWTSKVLKEHGSSHDQRLDYLRQVRRQLLGVRETLEVAQRRMEEKAPQLLHAAEDFDRAAAAEKEARQWLEKSRRQDPAGIEASAAIEAAAGGCQTLEEEKCYEWVGMLQEDKSPHAGIIAVEAECDYWEDQLHEHLLSALPRWKTTREGLERLDAELQDLADERKFGSDRCLEALDRDHPTQPFRHLRSAYALLETLRQNNDSLAAVESGLRWQRLSEGENCEGSDRSPEKEDEKYLPPGPKFFSVAQLLRPEEPPPPPAVPTRMPKAVVSRSEWFSPWNPQAETGNSFLPSLMSSRRLQPSETGSLAWGRPGSYCFEPSIFSGDYWDPFGGPLPSKTPSSAEVLRRAFEEPLSEALGSGAGAGAGHSQRNGGFQPTMSQLHQRKVPSSLEKRQRSGWVTFEATVQTPTSPRASPNYAVTLPIHRPPSETDAWAPPGPSRWEVAWPDLAETAPANGALESPTAVPSAWGSWERPQESIQLSD